MGKLYWYECVDCGQSVRSFWRPEDKRVCVDCGIRRSVRASLEMRNHSGEAYTRWQQSKGPKGRPPRNTPKE